MTDHKPIALEHLDAEAEADRLLAEDDALEADAGRGSGEEHDLQFEQELNELEGEELGLPRPVVAIKPVSTVSEKL